MPLELRELSGGDPFLAESPGQGRHDFGKTDDTQPEFVCVEAKRLDCIASRLFHEPLRER